MLNKNTKAKTHKRWYQEYKAAFLVALKRKEVGPCLRVQIKNAIRGIRYLENRKDILVQLRAAGMYKNASLTSSIGE